MKDLNLPIIKNMYQDNKTLTMDEYLEFVHFNLKYTLNRKEYDKQKKLECVKVPFTIK